MNKPVILVDCDDVLIHTSGTWIEKLNDKYGTNYDYRDIKDWDFSVLFPDADKSELMEPLADPQVWEAVNVIPGAQKYMRKLYEEGNELYILSASDYSQISYKYMTILSQFFPYIDQSHIIICHNKQLIKGDVLVDDYENNLVGGDYAKILFDCTHNQGVNTDALGLVRAFNWRDCYEKIHKIVEKDSSE